MRYEFAVTQKETEPFDGHLQRPDTIQMCARRRRRSAPGAHVGQRETIEWIIFRVACARLFIYGRPCRRSGLMMSRGHALRLRRTRNGGKKNTDKNTVVGEQKKKMLNTTRLISASGPQLRRGKSVRGRDCSAGRDETTPPVA